MLESAAGTPDLYDFQARSYNPALGTFTSLDSKLGSAQNTALLNGYLYANANPATLVDPDGHSTQRCWMTGGSGAEGGGQWVCVEDTGPTNTNIKNGKVDYDTTTSGRAGGEYADPIEVVRSRGGPGGEQLCPIGKDCSTAHIIEASEQKTLCVTHGAGYAGTSDSRCSGSPTAEETNTARAYAASQEAAAKAKATKTAQHPCNDPWSCAVAVTESAFTALGNWAASLSYVPGVTCGWCVSMTGSALVSGGYTVCVVRDAEGVWAKTFTVHTGLATNAGVEVTVGYMASNATTVQALAGEFGEGGVTAGDAGEGGFHVQKGTYQGHEVIVWTDVVGATASISPVTASLGKSVTTILCTGASFSEVAGC